MYKKFNTSIIVSTFILLISGCSWNDKTSQDDFTYRESILTKANNHGGLITLYRDKLKIKEDDNIRLKLANSYYLSGDSKSSLYYLKPIAHKQSESIYLLQAKSLINEGNNTDARIIVNKLLEISPSSAEAHNINGIILANSGEMAKAENAIERSRALFISDETAMNNLAVIAILDNRYADAVRILLPSYLAGKRNSLMLHNLVFSLIKLGDKKYAKKIITAEKISKEPDELILAISQISSPYQDKLSDGIE
ncbi:putative tight adherance operon protein [Yersinia frederiksenii]|uniref:tetratricopeptide repeat protein n=1 Tax=Yersinia frederiksenii TaxID=29484 RepID=UPI0005E5BAD3|nr:tetratricopeptide repeat protein [Yersinia frederiksenii]CNC50295.1 putative tight adherance operon protein [Yersinia frederiksenii]